MILGTLVCNISTAQEASTVAGRLIEIPPQKPDSARTPPEPERQRIPLGVSSARRTVEGKKAILQKIDEPERLAPMDVTLTLEDCEGEAMSQEEAQRRNNTCATIHR